MGKGYVIAIVENITDHDKFAKYSQEATPSLERFGGKLQMLARDPDPVEGTLRPARLVVVEFESLELAQAWYHSSVYRPFITDRQEASRSTLFIAEGP